VNRMKSARALADPSFVARVGLAVGLAAVAHQFGWKWLRFATSEIILRFASQFGFETARRSFDTIWINGTFFRFAISCTFIDVALGAIPLLWNGGIGLRKNLLCVGGMTGALLCFNIVRLTVSQLLYAGGLPWLLADGLLGGVSYFAIWLVVTDRFWKKVS
jgi:hypothetical protein